MNPGQEPPDDMPTDMPTDQTHDDGPNLDAPNPDGREIVVGLTTSASSRRALRWASALSRRSRVGVRAVHVLDEAPARSGPARADDLRAEGVRRRKISWDFDAAGPTPDWVLQFSPGQPGPVLVRQSRRAGLLVVGTRGPPGGRSTDDEPVVETGAGVSPVAAYCLQHADCAVVSVPPPGNDWPVYDWPATHAPADDAPRDVPPEDEAERTAERT